MPLDKGTRLGPYEIETVLGTGGMGEVYRARDARLGRAVALKVVGENYAKDADFVARFAREARLLAAINDPNIAVLYEFDSDGPQHYVVMELVEGETLARRLARGPVAVGDALPWFLQIAKGLEAAHRRGIVHRDLKPANIKITPDDMAKILDFGLSKQSADSEHTGVDPTVAPTLALDVSQKGLVIGTPPYMSPEQVRGQEVDKRADIWAFGCVLYEALTGRRAFAGNSPSEIMTAILAADPDWSLLPDETPASMVRVLRRCLCKDLRQRLQDIGDARIELGELVAPLSCVSQSGSISRRPTWWEKHGSRITLVSLVVIAVALALMFTIRSPTKPVVLLMDSASRAHVYDDETRRNGLTNAHDLTACLRDLSLTTHMELISPAWGREREVIEEHPALIVIHRSAFAAGEEPIDWSTLDKESSKRIIKDIYEPGWERLLVFLGTVAASSRDTKFVVYSRNWRAEGQVAWKAKAVQRFPALKGRLDTLAIPADEKGNASFRESKTATLVSRKVAEELGIIALQNAVGDAR